MDREILVHVAMHGACHRGITSILTRRSGGTPAPTDYIAWVRGAPTATRADAERNPCHPLDPNGARRQSPLPEAR